MSEYEARSALQQVFDRYQGRHEVRRGLLGDSSGTVMVASRPGWAYIRYRDDLNRLSIVRYLIPEQLPDGCPVKVGRKYPDDPFEQVLGVDWEMYAWSPTSSTTSQWATPAITLEDLAPGKVVPTSPLSLSVDVRAFLYVNGDTAVEFGGGQIDLTGSVPGVAGHRLTLVYIDLDTDALAAEDGAIVAVGTNAAAPAVPENAVPLAVVDLANGDTEIDGDIIYQYKILYDAIGGEIPLSWLADYSRGYIIRGGAADWEAYDANDNGAALYGDGTDILSSTTPTWRGTHTWIPGDDQAAIYTMNAAQSVDIFQVQNSVGTVIAGYDERGIHFSNGGTDSRNYFAGNDAGNAAASDNGLVVIGYQAGDALTTGGQGVLIGMGAGTSLQDGDHVDAIGYDAAQYATSGNYIVAVGSYSVRYNQTGEDNTGVGFQALEGSGGVGGSNVTSDTAVGSSALSDVQTGADEDTAVGAYAGARLTTGTRDIFLGYGAGFRQTTIDDALFVDNRLRADAATELTHSIMYGTMGANPEDQQLTVNASAFHVGEDNTPAYGAFLTANDVAGVAVTIIANATGDVTVGMQVMYFVSESGGGTAGGLATVLNGGSADLYDDGTDVLTLAVAADGSVTLQRTAGATTFDVSLWACWV